MQKWLVAIALALASPAARAADSGLGLGLRVGYGIPMGTLVKDDTGAALDLGDAFSGKLPIWIDAGWRFDPSTYLGAYFEYAPGFVKDCPAGVSCSASDLRLGVNFLYHFAPAAAFDPWAGIGIGYEWLNLGVAGIDVGYHGWEFFNLQLGGDVALGSGFALGPYVAFGLGQYSRVTASLGSQSGSASIPGGSQALHEWLELGVKGTFNP